MRLAGIRREALSRLSHLLASVSDDSIEILHVLHGARDYRGPFCFLTSGSELQVNVAWEASALGQRLASRRTFLGAVPP